MTRPCKCRQIEGTPGATYFKPRAVPLCELEEVELSIEEFEALRPPQGGRCAGAWQSIENHGDFP